MNRLENPPRASRDPSSLVHTFDLYSVLPEGFDVETAMEHPVAGSPEQIAEFVLSLGELGFSEVRCDLIPKTADAIEEMQPVVDLVHAG